MATVLKRGFIFVHDSFLDPGWKPGPGQRYVDGPKAGMIVTRTTKDQVWYGYVGAPKAGWTLSRDDFVRRFLYKEV